MRFLNWLVRYGPYIALLVLFIVLASKELTALLGRLKIGKLGSARKGRKLIESSPASKNPKETEEDDNDGATPPHF